MKKENQKNVFEKNIKNELLTCSKLNQTKILKELKNDTRKGFLTKFVEDIPADLRVLEAKDLFISQASLTGESEPLEKFANLTDEKLNDMPKSPLDLDNLCFIGTNVELVWLLY